MSEKRIAFIPVYATRQKIDEANMIPGHIYFSTDSGEIFLDTEEERVKVGSSSAGASLFYSSQQTSEENPIENVEGSTILFKLNGADVNTGEATIKEDDLIIATDGAFYRFAYEDANGYYICTRMAISGSGGGGGIIPVVEQDLFLEYEGIDLLGSTYIYGQSNILTFTPSSTADSFVSFLLTAKDLNGEYPDVVRQTRLYNGEVYEFNTNLLPKSDNIEITVSVNSPSSQWKGGKGLTQVFSPIKVLEMYVKKPDNVAIAIATTDTSIPYIPSFKGLGGENTPVTANYLIDGSGEVTSVKLVSANSNYEQHMDIPMQSHGMHSIRLWLTVKVNDQDYNSEEITYEVPFVSSTDETPIIWIKDELGTITNYEPAVVQYMVYSTVAAQQGSPIEVSLYRGNELLNTEEVYYAANSWLSMDLTPYYEAIEDGRQANEFTLTCGPISKKINFIIDDAGARDLSLRYPNRLRMSFDSMGRSNKEIRANRNKWVSKANNYEALLKDFNWYTNGWMNDNDGMGSYLSVANGASVTFPLPLLTGESAMAMNTNDKPWTFEMRFRVRNAKKFATLVTEIPKYRYIITVDGNDVESELGQEKTLDEINAIPNARPMLDEDGNMVMNEANTTKKVVQTEKYIAMRFLNSRNEGFAIGTQEAYFNTSGSTVNVKYKENEIINISFVVDRQNDALSIYLNGILSGVGSLAAISAISMESSVKFEINSTYCDFDLYKFRVYPLALTMPDIIHNYIADIKDVNIYDENQLTNVNDATALDYHALIEYNENHPDDPTMPYCVIDMTATSQGTDLPHYKGAKRSVRIEFTNPVADYLLNNSQITPYQYYTHCPSFTADNVELNVQGTSSQKYPRRNFKAKFKKSKNWVYTQGELANSAVSSGGALASGQTLTGNWHVDHETIGSNAFTWKIDYMESSGSYNTGFANLMGSGIYDKHPLEDLNLSGVNADDYRVNVYGFPMLVFHKTAEDTYTYIGRYNMNLDKSSNERYGFELKKEHPFINEPWDEYEDDKVTVKKHHEHPYVKTVAECWELRDNQGTWCSFRYPNAEMRAAGFNARMQGSTEADPKIEVAQHFEARYHADADQFEYAQNIILGKENTDDYSAEIGGSTNAAASAYVYNKLSHLESLFNWLDSTDITGIDNSTARALNPAVRQLVSSKLTKTIENPNFNYDEYIINPKTYGEPEFISIEDTEAMADNGVTYETVTEGGIQRTYGIFTKDSREYRRQKFYSEFEKHLDLHYCCVYFVMTELMLCYDSRGKNMMIASWGPREVGGDYIWYPIFYDIDTQLGLNNVGAKLWDYDEDCSENGTFSTKDSVLWTNLYDVFKSQIISTYRSLRNGKIDETTIENAYMCRAGTTFDSYAMLGKRPIVAIGLDEYYKYVLPVTKPWKDQEGNMVTANYLYACQGDRILSRELLIENRLLYMDSKWLGGTFGISTGGMAGANFRSTGNKPSTSSDIYLDGKVWSSQAGDYVDDASIVYPVPYYDAVPEYMVTPYLNFYVTTFVDENTFQAGEAYNEAKYPNGIPTVISPSVAEGYKNGKVDQQLNYFAGSKYISSFGDLSLKYLNEIHFPNTPRLLDITLGSDAPGYFNAETLNPLELNTELNTDGTVKAGHEKPLLQKINLSHVRGVNTYLDLRSPDKLEEFRALDTSLRYALFADGAPLNTVHLPSTITRLIFTQNKELKKLITSTPVVADMVNGELVYRPHEQYEGLFVDGITNYTDQMAGTGSLITEVSFEGDALGYGSYTILKNIVARKKNTGRENRLSIRMADINWTPYVQVEYGEAKHNDTTYYLLTDHSTYELYDRDDDLWYDDTLNGKVYTYNSEMDETTIQDLSLFKLFYDDKNNTPANEVNQFTNNIEAMINQQTYPTISGEVYIANQNGAAIDESDLTDKYGVAFPNLKIRVANVNPAYIVKYVQILPTGKEDEIDIIRFSPTEYNGQSPTLTAKTPTRTNNTFKGWALDKLGTKMVYEFNLLTRTLNEGPYISSEEFKFSASNSVITLYAIFEPEKLGIKFYDGDGSLLVEDPANPVYYVTGLNQQEQVTKLVSYESLMSPLKVLPYKDDTQLSTEETYILKGWSTAPESERNRPLITNLYTEPIRNNLTLYPVFVAGSVYNNILDPKYLEASPSLYTHHGTEGVYIKLASGCSVRGKITLPKTFNNRPVYGIAADGFRALRELKMVFWEEGATPYVIDQNAFYASGLIYFDFKPSIEEIRARAFYWLAYPIVYEGGGGGLMNRNLDIMENLHTIQANAFNRAFSDSKGVGSILFLPGSLTIVGTNSFRYNPLYGVSTYVLGDSTHPSSLASEYGSVEDNSFVSGEADYPCSIIVYTNNREHPNWTKVSAQADGGFSWGD